MPDPGLCHLPFPAVAHGASLGGLRKWKPNDLSRGASEAESYQTDLDDAVMLQLCKNAVLDAVLLAVLD